MRIATLNLQNLRLLKDPEAPLHGAWDSDDPEDTALDDADRKLTAELLGDINADVVALQEVFDLASLDYFHEHYLLPAGLRPYGTRICLPGNDGRGLDVALLSRRPPDCVRGHAAIKMGDLGISPPAGVDPALPVFCRDCLMAQIGPLTLFVCHFKSPYPDVTAAWTRRRLEALATRRLIERSFRTQGNGLWLVLGDLNEPDGPGVPEERATAPLETGFSVDLMARIPAADRWTYYDPHSGLYHCPDRLLASPALAAGWPETRPVILRRGLGREAARFEGPRMHGTGHHRPHASDHAAVAIEFEGL